METSCLFPSYVSQINPVLLREEIADSAQEMLRPKGVSFSGLRHMIG